MDKTKMIEIIKSEQVELNETKAAARAMMRHSECKSTAWQAAADELSPAIEKLNKNRIRIRLLMDIERALKDVNHAIRNLEIAIQYHNDGTDAADSAAYNLRELKQIAENLEDHIFMEEK